MVVFDDLIRVEIFFDRWMAIDKLKSGKIDIVILRVSSSLAQVVVRKKTAWLVPTLLGTKLDGLTQFVLREPEFVTYEVGCITPELVMGIMKDNFPGKYVEH